MTELIQEFNNLQLRVFRIDLKLSELRHNQESNDLINYNPTNITSIDDILKLSNEIKLVKEKKKIN